MDVQDRLSTNSAALILKRCQTSRHQTFSPVYG
jgi:hypothetical protein